MSRTTMLPMQFKQDLLHHHAWTTRAAINKDQSALREKGFLVYDRSEQTKTSFQSSIPHFHKHLCLLCPFKEHHHQLTRHLAPVSFLMQIENFGYFLRLKL